MNRIKGLNIGAECIGGLELIDHNYIVYESERYGITVNLSTPAVYCIHKILINDTRTTMKAEKDAITIKRLLPLVLYSQKGREDFCTIYSSLSKKQKKKFELNAERIGVIQLIHKIL